MCVCVKEFKIARARETEQSGFVCMCVVSMYVYMYVLMNAACMAVHMYVCVNVCM